MNLTVTIVVLKGLILIFHHDLDHDSDLDLKSDSKFDMFSEWACLWRSFGKEGKQSQNTVQSEGKSQF